jgi:O-antigen/teichoic acid export membrane protein
MSTASVWIGVMTRRLRSNRLCGAAAWSVSAAVTGRFAALLSAVLLARILGPARYGEYALVLSTVMMVSSVATSGVGVAASKYLADVRGGDPALCPAAIGAIAVIVAVFAGTAGVALWWGAPALAVRHFHRPEMGVLLTLGAPALGFAIVLGAAQGALNGMERFRAAALLGGASAIVLACVLPASAYFFGTLGALGAWALVTAMSACWAVRHVFSSRHLLPAPDPALLWRETRRFSAMSVPIVLGALVMAPVNWIALSLLAKSPSGIVEVGHFSAAYQWYVGLTFVPSVIANACLPLLSRLCSAGDGQGFSALVRDGVTANALMACASSALIWVSADVIMKMYGPEYVQSASLLRWLAVASAANGLNVAIGQAMTASNRLWTGVFVNLAWCAVFLGWVAATVSHAGAQALAQALVVAYTVHTLIHLALLRGHLRRAHAHGGPEK